MQCITSYIQNGPVFLAWITLALAFVGLTKFADIFRGKVAEGLEKVR